MHVVWFHQEPDFLKFMKDPLNPGAAEAPAPPGPEEQWAEITGQENVNHLTSSTFDDFMDQQNSALVMFYAPCKLFFVMFYASCKPYCYTFHISSILIMFYVPLCKLCFVLFCALCQVFLSCSVHYVSCVLYCSVHCVSCFCLVLCTV